jgi:hypothetical protein
VKLGTSLNHAWRDECNIADCGFECIEPVNVIVPGEIMDWFLESEELIMSIELSDDCWYCCLFSINSSNNFKGDEWIFWALKSKFATNNKALALLAALLCQCLAVCSYIVCILSLYQSIFEWQSKLICLYPVFSRQGLLNQNSIKSTGIQGAVESMEISAESQSFPAQHSWTAAAAPNHDGLPILGWITN